MSTERVFFGGHSLGGIVLESYISGHAELAQVKFISGAYQIQNILKNMIWKLTIKKKIYFQPMLFCVPMGSLKNASQFGPVVWPGPNI